MAYWLSCTNDKKPSSLSSLIVSEEKSFNRDRFHIWSLDRLSTGFEYFMSNSFRIISDDVTKMNLCAKKVLGPSEKCTSANSSWLISFFHSSLSRELSMLIHGAFWPMGREGGAGMAGSISAPVNNWFVLMK